MARGVASWRESREQGVIEAGPCGGRAAGSQVGGDGWSKGVPGLSHGHFLGKTLGCMGVGRQQKASRWGLTEELESLGSRDGEGLQVELKGVTISATLLSCEVGLGLVE